MKIEPNTIYSDEIHIWSACLSDYEKNLDYFASILSSDEHVRANSFRFLGDKNRFIAARGILRYLLSSYLDLPPQSISFIYGQWGKSFLLPKRPISFNVSHSKDHALYAITLKYEVGIDLEYIDSKMNIEDIVVNVFSPIQLNEWKQLPYKDKVDTFFNAWVCKEAFLKAHGRGWIGDKMPPENIENHIFKRRTIQDFQSLNNNLMYPYCFELISGYASALFVAGSLLRVVHYRWE